MVHWSKVEIFSMFLFLAKSASKMYYFDDNYSRKKKKEFLDSKIRKLKKSKNQDFSKGVSPWLWKKLKFFHVFIFGKINRQNVFDVILESQKAFLDYKKQKNKKSKNQDFCKGVSPWFW